MTQTQQSYTLRSPPYTYLHLCLISVGGHKKSEQKASLDSVTVYSYLNSALSRFLGLHGSAISFDILKESEKDVWIRTSTEDASAIVAALSQWSSRTGEVFKIVGKGAWLGGISGDEVDRDKLFSLEG